MDFLKALSGHSLLARFSLITLACILLAQLALVAQPGGSDGNGPNSVLAEENRPGLSFSFRLPDIISNLVRAGNNGRGGNDRDRNDRGGNDRGRNDRDRNGNRDDRNSGRDNNRGNGGGRSEGGGNSRGNDDRGNNRGGSGGGNNGGGNNRGGENGPTIIQLGMVKSNQASEIIDSLSRLQDRV